MNKLLTALSEQVAALERSTTDQISPDSSVSLSNRINALETEQEKSQATIMQRIDALEKTTEAQGEESTHTPHNPPSGPLTEEKTRTPLNTLTNQQAEGLTQTLHNTPTSPPKEEVALLLGDSNTREIKM